jgi:hypothetical protein
MRPIGFSTGALAKGNFTLGLNLQRSHASVSAVELSALRDHELQPLVEAVSGLDLKEFEYVSFHAPSKLGALDENAVFDLLKNLPESWPIIAHPEIIRTSSLWTRLGSRLCVENMDNRKAGGRTVAELRDIFASLPNATFCLDVGHAKQIDPTMITAILMLREFGGRLRQIHVSDVGPRGEHRSVGVMARLAFSRVAAYIPKTCPLIIESIIDPEQIDHEMRAVIDAFDEVASYRDLFSATLQAVDLDR